MTIDNFWGVKTCSAAKMCRYFIGIFFISKSKLEEGGGTFTRNVGMGKSVSVGDTLPHTVFGVCGEFQRTGRFGDTLPHTVVGVCGEFQRTGRFVVPRSAVPSVRSSL